MKNAVNDLTRPKDMINKIMAQANINKANFHLSSPSLTLNSGKGGKDTMEVPDISEMPLMVAALRAKAKKPKKGAKLVTLMNIVLDESGSMSNGCSQTMTGYNLQLDALRPSAKEIGCRVTQVNFSNKAYAIARDEPVTGIVPLSSETYQPCGGTALYDTVAAVIKAMLKHPLANDDNTSVLLSVTTDGDDTSSTIWKTPGMKEFRELMQAVKANDRWTLALAGPDDKLRELADLMGVESDNVAAFKPDSVSSRGMALDASVSAMSSYTSIRSSGMKKSDILYAGTQASAMAKAIIG